MRGIVLKGVGIAGMAMMASAQVAIADGFVCESVRGDLTVKVFNHTDPSVGTRVGALMVLSDPNVGEGRKTIARFSDAKGRLLSSGSHYEGDVDLRYSDTRRRGELIAGTRLGELETVVLDVDFTYAEPVRPGAAVKGDLTLVKRNGDEVTRSLECKRHLKRG
jgi:hypothetical protein